MQTAGTMQSFYMAPSSKKIPKDDRHQHTKALKEQSLQTDKKQIPFIAPSPFIFCMTHTYDQHRTSNRPYIRHMKALYSPFPFRIMIERSSSHQCEDEKCSVAETHRLRNLSRNQKTPLHSLHPPALNPLRSSMCQS